MHSYRKMNKTVGNIVWSVDLSFMFFYKMILTLKLFKDLFNFWVNEFWNIEVRQWLYQIIESWYALGLLLNRS